MRCVYACLVLELDTLNERMWPFNSIRVKKNEPWSRRAASRQCIFVNASMRYSQSRSLMNVLSNRASSRRSVPVSDTSSRKYRGTSSPRRKCRRCRSVSDMRSCILSSNARKSKCAFIPRCFSDNHSYWRCLYQSRGRSWRRRVVVAEGEQYG